MKKIDRTSSHTGDARISQLRRATDRRNLPGLQLHAVQLRRNILCLLLKLYRRCSVERSGRRKFSKSSGQEMDGTALEAFQDCE